MTAVKLRRIGRNGWLRIRFGLRRLSLLFRHMQTCITCGMPFEGNHANDIGMELPEGPVCKFDCENGELKSPQEIFVGGVTYFTDAVAEGDRELAERLTRTNMKS